MCNHQSMTETVDQPVAVRATAFIRPSRWLHHPVRLVTYDACWADGRVGFDVSLSKMMYRGFPADFAAIDESVHAHCPEVGTGPWVDEFGRVVEGPAQVDPNHQGRGRGERRKYGVSRYESNPKVDRAWRLGRGVAGLGLGAFLTVGPVSHGIAGFVGVIFCAGGLASLAGLIPSQRRWW
jgi:hypothetical protein